MPRLVETLEKRARSMARMMDRLGLDPARAWTMGSALAMGQAARRCAACGSVEACAAWLDAGAAGEAEAHRRFCPNAGTFERLRGA
jgi:hypothetical protein